MKDMEAGAGRGQQEAEILSKLAQYEPHPAGLGGGAQGLPQVRGLTSKCWPAFQTQFGFVPCYVNSV